MKYLKSSLLFPILLIIIVLIISYQNYIPGTYLSGWDTIHPEFDFLEYFKRVFSVWQEHQGLGAPAAQAHASEIPRLIIYYLSSLILPASFLRYGYFFMTLIIGVLGVYYFVKEISKHAGVAFVSALFYLLNLSTLQTYVLPLEMFATHFASLGWLFLFSTKYILEGKKKNLLIFAFVALLSTAIAHTPTLFYVFFGVFALFLIILSALKKKIKKGITLIALILLINSFWLLPNIYYVLNFGNTVVESKISTQFSDRAFQVGENYGNIADTALLKNFLFEWGEYNNKQGQFSYILGEWSTHLKQPGVTAIGYFLFILSVSGIILSIIKKNPVGISFGVVFLIPFFFICNDNPLFRFFYDNILSKSSVFKESLRFPFTKFSIMLSFAYAIYLSFTMSLLFDQISKLGRKFKAFFSALVLVLLSLSLIYFAWPFFTGSLINYKMKVNIPGEYFEMFDYFRTQDPASRIAYLPMNTFWGWTYYNWGYEGAGFMWFGLRQPILNREFDRWTSGNEGFYWEASHAIYSQDLPLLESVLAKYKVNWLIMDEEVVDVSSSKSTYQDEFLGLIKDSNKISLAQKFNHVLVFRVQNPVAIEKFMTLEANLPSSGPAYKFADSDQGYLTLGEYKAATQPDVFYPFRELFSNQLSQKPNYSISETDSEFILSSVVPNYIADYQIYLPQQTNKLVPWFDASKLEEAGFTIPKVSFNGSMLLVKIPKVKSLFSSEIDSTKLPSTENINCDYLAFSESKYIGTVENQVIESDGVLRLKSRHASNCSARFILPQLPHHLGYLISSTSKNISGNSLLFWLENQNARKADLETYLPKSKVMQTTYFFVPPMDEFGAGYTIHFDNWSFNNDETVNDLGRVAIYPVQWDFLSNIAFVKPNFQANSKQIPLQTVTHQEPFFYTVKIEADNQNKTLSLFQSYDDGWVAWLYPGQFPLSLIENHIKVDNWANGWEIGPYKTGTVIIFYWPQLLLWSGLGLMLGTFGVLIYKHGRK
ncbi:MAG: hypothetical protein WCV81_05465 [Microgenomates group bacterium]|jgi:hypothetical protein